MEEIGDNSIMGLTETQKKVDDKKIVKDVKIIQTLREMHCTPHSGTEMSPSYLMLNRQIKNIFDLLRTKTSKI